MKNKTIILLTLLLGLFGCEYSSEVNNPDRVTTLELQNSIIDSCAVIAYVEGEDVIYVLKDGKAVTRYWVTNSTPYVIVGMVAAVVFFGFFMVVSSVSKY